MNKNGFDGLQEVMENLHLSQQQPLSHQISHGNSRNNFQMKMAKVPPMDSYYAINAPAPGTVGVASARVNKSYVEGHDKDYSLYSQHYANAQPYYANNVIPSNQRFIPNTTAALPSHTQVRGERALYANVAPTSPASHYTSYGYDGDFPPAPEEVPAPSSPVSSSYSELRHGAIQHQHQCHQQNIRPHGAPQCLTHQSVPHMNPPTYAPLSHTSSAYESIYEPLTPRSSSQMSDVSCRARSPFVSPKARGLAPAPSDQPVTNPDQTGKEAEVDALTSLLVQSMDSSGDASFFGICASCGEKVIAERSGCIAMDQVFHIQCFCCVVCLLKLQGKPFYCLDAKPYCEDCYLNTLVKCCVCTKPIMDRILRATGKPYHTHCFTCVVCQKSLDGIPFTVDASNQIHCIEDFHKKFAPRCSVCEEPIMPVAGQDETWRVVALDRSFHVACYKCEDCGMLLSSEAENKGCYPLDNHVLCKSCNARRVRALTP